MLGKSAGIYEEKLDDPRRAIERNEEVLGIDGGNLPAIKALERLYRQERLWEKLISVSQHHLGLVSDRREQVALEVAIGAAFSGARALATMKHVGLNVAADPLFTAAYTGVTGGLVIVSADDPGMASSQNEQDNRRYAVAAGVPMFEPSDSQEAYDFTLAAFELSRMFLRSFRDRHPDAGSSPFRMPSRSSGDIHPPGSSLV